MSVLSLAAVSSLAAGLSASAAGVGGGPPQVIPPPAESPGLGFFGGQVAVQGNEMFVGSPLTSKAGAFVGAVYRYTRTPDGEWVFREFILPEFQTLPFLNFFGTSVSVDGDLLVVGAPRESDPSQGGFFQGAAYVFQFQPTETGGSWNQILRVGGTQALQFYGFDVDVSGDTVAVGAPGDGSGCEGGGFCFSGAIFMHDLDFSPCRPDAGACLFPNGSPGCENQDCCEAVCAVDPFCCETAWDIDCADLAGGCDSVEVSGTCREFAGVVCTDPLFAPTPEEQEWVGRNIALDGNYLITGAHPFTDSDEKAAPEDRTVAYVFERDAVLASGVEYESGLWREAQPISIDSIEVTEGFFGFVEDVALSRSSALIGLFWEGEDATGGVWSLARSGETQQWELTGELPLPLLGAGDQFGWAVDMRGDRALVGARQYPVNGFFSGAAYLYSRPEEGGEWALVEKLTATDPGNDDDFGFSVSLAEDAAGDDWAFVSAAGRNEVFAFDRPFADTFGTGELYITTSGGPAVCDQTRPPTDTILRVRLDTQHVERFADVPCMDGRVATFDPFRDRLIVRVAGDRGALRQIDAAGHVTELVHNLDLIDEWGDRTIRAIAPTGDGRLYCIGVDGTFFARIAVINADGSVELITDAGGIDGLFTEASNPDLAMIYDSAQDALFIAESLGVAVQVRRVRLNNETEVGGQTVAAFDAISDTGLEVDLPTQFSVGIPGFLTLHVRGEATSMAEPRMQLVSTSSLANAPWALSDYAGVGEESAGTYSSLLDEVVVLDTVNDQLRTYERLTTGAGTTFTTTPGVSSAVSTGERAMIISIGDTIANGPENGPFQLLPPPPANALGDDVADAYTALVARIFETWGPCPTDGACVGDLNRDGQVDQDDLVAALRFEHD